MDINQPFPNSGNHRLWNISPRSKSMGCKPYWSTRVGIRHSKREAKNCKFLQQQLRFRQEVKGNRRRRKAGTVIGRFSQLHLSRPAASRNGRRWMAVQCHSIYARSSRGNWPAANRNIRRWMAKQCHPWRSCGKWHRVGEFRRIRRWRRHNRMWHHHFLFSLHFLFIGWRGWTITP